MKKLTKHKLAFFISLISILVLFGGVGYFIFSISKLNNVENNLRLFGWLNFTWNNMFDFIYFKY